MPKIFIVIAIDNVLVSDNVVEKQFVCDLNKCKGACCEEGDAGAPLDDNELKIILALYEKVEPYLSAASVEEIGKSGKYVYHKEFGWVTPTLNNDAGICAYGIRAGDGIIKCAFEQAYYDGKSNWKKPLSCHLFPIIARKGKSGNHDTVNYEPRERLCNPACTLGKKLRIPAYEFLKEAIIRKYGEEFYETLDAVGKTRQKKKQAI